MLGICACWPQCAGTAQVSTSGTAGGDIWHQGMSCQVHSIRELSCIRWCHSLQESAESRPGALKDRRFLISMKTLQMSWVWIHFATCLDFALCMFLYLHMFLKYRNLNLKRSCHTSKYCQLMHNDCQPFLPMLLVRKCQDAPKRDSDGNLKESNTILPTHETTCACLCFLGWVVAIATFFKPPHHCDTIPGGCCGDWQCDKQGLYTLCIMSILDIPELIKVI